MAAPASAKRRTARSKPVAGASSMPSKAVVSRTRNRAPDIDAPRRSGARPPSRAARTNAASSTDRQSGPMVSNFAQSGRAPSRETRPAVVFRPTRSFQTDGMRTEPPVSEPTPQEARPNATEAAAPDEEPPGTASGSFTQGGVAVIGL